MKNKMPVIETERLLLREISYKDLEDMYEYSKLPYVGPSAGWEPHRSIKDTERVIEIFLNKRRYGQLGVFAIVLRSESKMIGTVELHSYIPGFKAELGYTVNPNYWGKGYATEASIAMLNYGFRKLNLTRIESTTFIDNYPSKRVCEKIGLRFEGIRKKGYLLYNGTIHDVLAFGITDEEYFEKYGKEDNKVVYLYE